MLATPHCPRSLGDSRQKLKRIIVTIQAVFLFAFFKVHQKLVDIKVDPAKVLGLPADDQNRFCGEITLPSVTLPGVNTIPVLTGFNFFHDNLLLFFVGWY